MLTYETETGGYEWFGRGEGHETLTAYGLQIFQQIKSVDQSIVDEATLKRNTDWLKSRKIQTSNQLYALNKKQLDTFGRSSQKVSDVYIVYTLAKDKSVGYSEIKGEIDYVSTITDQSNDPYLLSMQALSLFNVDKKAEAQILARKVLPM